MEVLTASGIHEYGHLKAERLTATQVAKQWKQKSMSAPIAYFDIETGPRPLAEIEQFMPVEWPLGNLKDPDKIEAAIAAKKQAWLDDAALSPVTGQVLVIGVEDRNGVHYIEGKENAILETFWGLAVEILGASGSLVGFNVKLFDLPFLIRRSWALNVHVPSLIRTRWHGRIYFNENIIDLRDDWQLGDKQAHGSLDVIGKLLTGNGKSGSGADFAKLYQTDKEAALLYLANDLSLTKACHERMSL